MNIKTSSTEPLPPDDEKAGDIYARLGYKFADAVADLVDNSIDAEATKVHIRFVRGKEGIRSVILADNGSGMGDAELREAMRVGSRSSKSSKNLGKYGIGLKSASLSQADTVTVISRRRNAVAGRRWTLENVKKNWTSEILDPADVRGALNQKFGAVSVARSGTVVIWNDLEHLKALPSNVDTVLDRTFKELQTELGIRFHRFIEAGRLSIGIDQQFDLETPTNLPLFVAPLNPFGYEPSQSPVSRYPLSLSITISGSKVPIEFHIWPPKSGSPNYKLGGGKVALRQGFYFYRNDRVIQAGGWNHLKADDGEPHFSLARVKIDLPGALDSKFKLDVTKSRLDPAPEFLTAIAAIKTADGITFERYTSQAQAAYRKQKTKERAKFPVVPGTGVAAKARDAIQTILREEGTGRPTKVAFKWSTLDIDEMFRLDSENNTILLNSRHRSRLREGDTNDAPVLKLTLMFLLQDELGKAFLTKVGTERIQKINQALIASLKT